MYDVVMDSEPVDISVVILNWNRKCDAAAAIRSVLKNQPTHVEIILWDNASEDGSKDYLQNLFSGESHVRFVWHDKNDGVCISRNLAVEMAQGETIVFMDSDSLLETPNGLLAAHKRLNGDPEAGALNFQILNRNKTPLWPFSRAQATWGLKEFEITRIDGCGFAIKRNLFQKVGGFPNHFGYGAEEHYLARRCINNGSKVLYFPEVSITHLHVPSGRTSDQFVTMMRNHLWMPLELFRMPWAMISVMKMLLSYGKDALEERRLGDYFKGLWIAVRDFRFSRRKPMSREGWRHFRHIIKEDRGQAN